MKKQCGASDINDCKNDATIELLDSRGRPTNEHVCCEECGNELAGELSEGCWVPFPNASNARTPEQVEEALSYFREDY